MATSLTQETIEPDEVNLRRSSIGKSSSPNIGQNKSLDHLKASTGSRDYGVNSRRNSRGKPTISNNGQNISASTGSSLDLGNIARNSTGKPSSPNSGESVSPHYLRASTGSCHDFCKYGRKHEFEVKPWRPIPKRVITQPSNGHNATEVGVSAVRKTTMVVKPKLSPVSKTLSADSPSFIKKEVSSPSIKVKVSPKQASPNEKRRAQDEKNKNVSGKHAPVSKTLPVNSPSIIKKEVSSPSNKFEVSSRQASSNEKETAQDEKRKNFSGQHAPVSKTLSIDSPSFIKKEVPSPSNKVESSSKQASSDEKTIAQDEKKKNSSGKRAPVKPETMMLKPSSSSDTSLGLNGRKSSEIKVAKKTGTPKAAVKKTVVTPVTSLFPKPSNSRAVSLNVKQHRSVKLLSPLKDKNNVRKAEPKQPNSEKVPEKTLHVIKVETEKKVLDSAQNNSTIHSPLSPALLSPKSSSLPKSPALSFHEEEDQEESEYTDSEVDETDDSISENSNTVNLHEDDTSEGNQNRTPRKGRVGISDDCKPSKLKFRRGTVVDPQSENSGPRRLRFRRGRVLGGNQGNNSDVRKRSFKKRGVEDDANGTDPSSEKVVLRHQDVQGKKDAQGLFNNVIEETASKLVESRKSKVKALVGAFETVISLQETKPST